MIGIIVCQFSKSQPFFACLFIVVNLHGLDAAGDSGDVSMDSPLVADAYARTTRLLLNLSTTVMNNNSPCNLLIASRTSS